jgi:hypothetical protein
LVTGAAVVGGGSVVGSALGVSLGVAVAVGDGVGDGVRLNVGRGENVLTGVGDAVGDGVRVAVGEGVWVDGEGVGLHSGGTRGGAQVGGASVMLSLGDGEGLSANAGTPDSATSSSPPARDTRRRTNDSRPRNATRAS